jgi:hypothetical protein
MFGINLLGKKRKQSCLLLTEDGRILDIKLPVVKGYVVEHKTAEAWGLFPDSRIPERGTNRLFQVITERDCAPMSLNGQKSDKGNMRMKKDMSQIAQENAQAARAAIQKKSAKNKIAETLQLLAIIFGIVVCVLVVFGLISTGKLHLPNFGGGGGGSIFG